MSWDATLTDSAGNVLVDQNYTHNTNGMIAAALEAAGKGETPLASGPLGPAIGPAWWRRLDGATGRDGRALLATIVTELERAPSKYKAMNPENGWGSYESLLPKLRTMRDAVPDGTTTWHTSG